MPLERSKGGPLLGLKRDGSAPVISVLVSMMAIHYDGWRSVMEERKWCCIVEYSPVMRTC
jgi:hypothetical protein